MNRQWIVLTSIYPPTAAVEKFARLASAGWSVVVVGDRKTPADWQCEGVDYLGVQAQRDLFPGLADLIPYGHYCRKNLGYLYAMRNGAKVILETDDDNIPYEGFGEALNPFVAGRKVVGPGWVNVYRHFTADFPVWPRGLPLDAIRNAGSIQPAPAQHPCPIQQYLVDADPDVDAIYRLVIGNPFSFRGGDEPVVLDHGAWCPFNSQNTAFFEHAFPLLYLPCHVSFRMTDIWRSFLAQAALGTHGQHVSFHAPTAEQLRNEHNLMKDFEDEVPGYLGNRHIMETLAAEAVKCGPDMNIAETALRLWAALASAGVIPEKELRIAEAWMAARE